MTIQIWCAGNRRQTQKSILVKPLAKKGTLHHSRPLNNYQKSIRWPNYTAGWRHRVWCREQTDGVLISVLP